MSDEIYRRLANLLDTLPNGFPKTRSGIEIKILKKVFTPDEAELFCDLKLKPETADQIAKRTGRPLEGLEDKLIAMRQRGEIQGYRYDGAWMFKLIPWIVGIFEFQLDRMDREFAQLCEEYSPYWGRQSLRYGPKLMQVVPVEKEIPAKQEALTYQQVSNLIEKAVSFMVVECICKKSQGLLDHPCKKPLEVCLAMAPIPGVFDNHPMGGRVIDRDEAYAILRKAEEAALVHLTYNVENGHHYICNCCGCCCGMLRAVAASPFSVVNSHYFAEIDPDACSGCGICADERCQVRAIKQEGDTYTVIREKCIGCGLCVTTCPSKAVRLIHKDAKDLVYPPRDDVAWLEERARQRGVDFSVYK